MRSPAICSDRLRWHRGNMSLLKWIWAYLFDCVHSHTTWPHQNQFGLAYVCCLDCGREMPYSLEYMQIVGQDRKGNLWDHRSPATAPLIIAGALLLLTPSYAVAQTAQFAATEPDPSSTRQVLVLSPRPHRVQAPAQSTRLSMVTLPLAHGSSFC